MSFLKSIFGNNKSNKENKIQQKKDPESELKKALDTLEKHKRKAYLPQTQNKENEFSSKSKFGGFPYLRDANDWPVCPNCNKNMQLFLQLDLEELPERQEEGLIQLFYCTSIDPPCESDLEAYFPFSKAVACRKIDISGESSQIKPKLQEVFSEKLIVGWEPVDDYPDYEEFDELGIDIDGDTYELIQEKDLASPVADDKLFGWPYWVQSVEYPFDRDTGSRMELLFQLASEDNLAFMFGDSGTGHLTQSPDNKNELGFGWACY